MPAPSSNDIPRNYVPGRGSFASGIFACGEAPGQSENAQGWPFVGQSGQELERYLAWGAGLFRQDIWLTNLHKYWPLVDWKGKQLPPSPEQIAEGTPELLMEIEAAQPRVIVAIGAHAARFFLGDRFQSIRRDAGIPRIAQVHRLDGSLLWEGPCLVVTHPAAGLHQDREQVNIQRDFEALGKLLRGEIRPRGLIDKPWHPKRRRIYDRRVYCADCRNEILLLPCCSGEEVTGVELTQRILAGKTQISIDTEGDPADPWCLTFCVDPGLSEGWLIRSTERECLDALNAHINAPGGICTCTFHYLAHDIPVCEPHPIIKSLKGLGIFVNKHRALNSDGSLTLRDTMSEYFLLGTEPKGLKPLGWRVLEVNMRSFEELVGPTEQEISQAFITRVFEELKCSQCGGAGKLARASTEMVADPACVLCGGSGKNALGKSGKPLKSPRPCECRVERPCVLKTLDRCDAGCVDGLLVPLPDREFVFDQASSEWRWKQPQSIGKWVRRRLKRADVQRDAEQGEVAQNEQGDAEVRAVDVDAPDDEPAHHYFKARRDWLDLEGRSDWEYVNAVVGRMPRTTLSEVEQREGEQAVTDYAVDDALVTYGIADAVEPRLAALGLLQVREQDAAFIPMLSRMEQIGMRIDRAHFERFDAYLDTKLDEIRSSLAATIGRTANPNSPAMAEVLFRDLGLPSLKLTKSGAREAIDDDVLGALKASLQKRLAANPHDQLAALQMSVVDHITDYREHRKLKDYTRPILRYSDRNDRIHTTFNYSSVATGRLSSSDPINLQTLPNPDNYPSALAHDWERNYGLRTRGGFVARPGYKLISADYNSGEMVVGAHLSQDPGMLRIFREGLDPHYYAANLMFDIPYDQVPKAVRTQTKPLNFGCWYGLSAMGLQAAFASLPGGAVEKSEAECQELIDRYYRAFPGVLEWKERLWEEAESTGYVRDLFGRIRWVPGLRSKIRKVRSAAEREAANMPIQSTLNGIIRHASRLLWEHTLPDLWAMGIDAEIIMQTHDENVSECPTEWAPFVGGVMQDVMKNAVTLSVPIKVGIAIGDNLAECK